MLIIYYYCCIEVCKLRKKIICDFIDGNVLVKVSSRWGYGREVYEVMVCRYIWGKFIVQCGSGIGYMQKRRREIKLEIEIGF